MKKILVFMGFRFLVDGRGKGGRGRDGDKENLNKINE